MATTQGWDESTDDCVVGNNQERNNGTGFSAVQAGEYVRTGSGNNYWFGFPTFWSTTDSGDGCANNRYFFFNSNEIGKDYYNKKESGCSVRCLKN